MRLDNSVPNAATCRSLELGVIRCVDEITEQVRRNTGLSVTDIQIERVLNGQSCSMDPAAKEIIVRQGRLYTEKILSAIMEAGFDLKAIPSVIMGGGASILKRHVTPQDGLCRQIYLTDVHANALRDHMKGRIDYCILEILKQISCVLFNTITMSDALAKVTEVLDFTEEKIVDILSDNHKVLGFFANNDLEEVKRKSEAIFSAITTSNVYQVEWAVLVLELIDWVRRYQYLISDRAKNILYSAVLEPIPYLNVVAGRELNPHNPDSSWLLLKKMGTDSGKVLYAGTMVKIDKKYLVSPWHINDAAVEKFAKCLVDAINMAKKWLDETEGEFILDPDYYGII